MSVKIYQIFEDEHFLGTCRSQSDEDIDETRRRLINDLGFSEDIAIFFVNYAGE